MKYEEKILDADGIKMRYYVLGEGVPMLFLHGGLVNALTYRNGLELLASKFLVIAPDIPCFGHSSVPGATWDFNDYADFFSKFIDMLPYDEIVLVGHSFGGGIALNLAAKNKKISKLVVIDSAGISPSYSIAEMFFLLIKKTCRGFAENRTAALFMMGDFIGTLFRNIFFSARIYKTIKKSIFNDCNVLGAIKQPTLILWGTEDELFGKYMAEKMNLNIENSKLEYIGENHDWCILKPQKFYDLIMRMM